MIGKQIRQVLTAARPAEVAPCQKNANNHAGTKELCHSNVNGGNWTLAEAQRTRAFWLLKVTFTLTWLVVFMPMVHIVPFTIDLGISHFLAAMTISVIGFVGFAARLAIGPISDRLGRTQSLGLCLLLQALSFLGFTTSTGLSLLSSAAAVLASRMAGSPLSFQLSSGIFSAAWQSAPL